MKETSLGNMSSLHPCSNAIIKGIKGIYDFRNISDFLSLKLIDSWLISAQPAAADVYIAGAAAFTAAVVAQGVIKVAKVN